MVHAGNQRTGLSREKYRGPKEGVLEAAPYKVISTFPPDTALITEPSKGEFLSARVYYSHFPRDDL